MAKKRSGGWWIAGGVVSILVGGALLAAAFLISMPTAVVTALAVAGGSALVAGGGFFAHGVDANANAQSDVPPSAEGAALVEQDQASDAALRAQEEQHRAEMEAHKKTQDEVSGLRKDVQMLGAQVSSMRSETAGNFNQLQQRSNRSGPAQAGLFAEGARRRGMRRDTAGSNPAANDAADADEPVHAAMP